MAWSNTPVNTVAGHSTSSVSSFTSTAFTTTAGNTVIVGSGCGQTAGATIAISDSKVNTYANGHTDTETTQDLQRVSIDHTINIPGGKAGSTTFTITPSSAAFCCIGAVEYSGGGLATLETAKNAAHTSTAGGTTTVPSPGVINPASSNDLYVMVTSYEADGAGGTVIFGAGTGWTKQTQDETNGFQNFNYQSLVGSGSQTATFGTKSGTATVWSWTAVVVAYAVAVTSAPFYSTDWVNPQARTPGIDLKSFVRSSEFKLLKDKQFGAVGQPKTYDYPNPIGTTYCQTRFPLELRTFLDPFESWLLKDTFFGPAGKGPTYDWPNPTLAKTPTPDVKFYFDPVDLPLLGQDKFFSVAGKGPVYDYPNPKGPAYPTSLRQWDASLLNFTLGVVAQSPFSQQDWPNPFGRLFAIDLRTWLANLLFSTLAPAPSPFSQSEWPNPKGYPYGADLRTFLEAVNLQLFGQDTFFGPPGQGAPFADFPNPRGALYPSHLRTFTDVLKLELLGKDLFFGAAGQPPANLDWPVPKGKQPSIDLKTFLDPLKLALQGQDVFFGGAGKGPVYDWPNPPKGAAYPTALRTFLDTVKLNLLGQDTFFGVPGEPPIHEWVNPPGKVYPQELRTWFNDLILNTLGVIPVFPFSLADWPNPKGAVYPVSLRTFIEPTVLELLGQDTFFGAVGQGPRFDYPNPKGAPYSIGLRTFLVPGRTDAPVLSSSAAANIILVDGRPALHIGGILYTLL